MGNGKKGERSEKNGRELRKGKEGKTLLSVAHVWEKKSLSDQVDDLSAF